uniref:Uncharacterized protein n=1 Tax=Anguilla anguilla TaxID=7936 RepID=A0A0E9S380_ANGAN
MHRSLFKGSTGLVQRHSTMLQLQ